MWRGQPVALLPTAWHKYHTGGTVGSVAYRGSGTGLYAAHQDIVQEDFLQGFAASLLT